MTTVPNIVMIYLRYLIVDRIHDTSYYKINFVSVCFPISFLSLYYYASSLQFSF